MLSKTTHSNIYFAVDSNQQFDMLHETYKNNFKDEGTHSPYFTLNWVQFTKELRNLKCLFYFSTYLNKQSFTKSNRVIFELQEQYFIYF